MPRTVGKTRRLRRAVRWTALATVWSLASLVAVAALARYMDGPLGPFPGGPLRRGALVEAEKVTTAMGQRPTVELQLWEPPRSRTTWIVEYDGQLYIPCLLMGPWKQWPQEAMESSRALIRSGDRLYSRDLVRVEDPEIHEKVLERMVEKYGIDVPSPDDVWFFRLERPFEAIAG